MANAVQDKSEALAVRIVNLWKYLLKHQEYDISRQVKRSGTSVGVNVCEALYAASKKDFLNKMYIDTRGAWRDKILVTTSAKDRTDNTQFFRLSLFRLRGTRSYNSKYNKDNKGKYR